MSAAQTDFGPRRLGVGWTLALTAVMLRAGTADAEPEVPPAPSDDAVVTPSEASVAPPEASAGGAEPEITIVAPNSARTLQRSAEAVTVVDTRSARQQTRDLGEVLARTQGVAVRRRGGLGSSSSFSLNGLEDEQVRFFLDGVPLELAGFPFGIANVPVNVAERVEIYRGVVPIRFGADALGGAVNVVSDRRYRTGFAGSYQVGSFGTQRVTLSGRYHHAPSGLFAAGNAFLDGTKNDYLVDVTVPNAEGTPRPVETPRFHDAYRAYGATLELGLVERPWAKRLSVQGFVSSYDKELQNNIAMTVPYGEVTYGETTYGGTARYAVSVSPQVELELMAGAARRILTFVDMSLWIYNWLGERVNPRRSPGEISGNPYDQTEWQNSGYGRALVSFTPERGHAVRVALSPFIADRSGESRAGIEPGERDPLSAQRSLATLIGGVEYQLDALQDRLSNILFVKDYLYAAHSEELIPGDVFVARDQHTHRLGVGDSLRYRVSPWLYAKASYEYATRLPKPDEVFGNGALIRENLELEPEVSHNLNLGPRIELAGTPFGELTADINLFLRDSDRLIAVLGADRFFTYQNVHRAVGKGVEGSAAWTSADRLVTLDGSATWQDVRNESTEGTFATFHGDRIPNRPYLFASWGARLRFRGLPGRNDSVQPFYAGRYVHEFYRGWESLGIRATKQVVDAQLIHDLGVTWVVNRPAAHSSATFEVDNILDGKAFDVFGVQRPGRAYFLKVTAEL